MAKCEICFDKFKAKYFNQKHCEKEKCKQDWRDLVLAKKKEKEAKFPSKKKKTIPRVSQSRKMEEIIYSSERIKFLMLPENKVCPITGKEATTIHHKKGRMGSLYLDKRFWVALSMEGHEFVEKNPIWAKEAGYSLSRLSNEVD